MPNPKSAAFPDRAAKGGIRRLIIEGKSPKPVYLYLHDGKRNQRRLEALGKNTKETQDLIKEENNDKKDPDCLHRPGGENLNPFRLHH